MNGRTRSSATPLAWAMAVLVLYASLYPFSGWQWPAGSPASALLALPWPPWLTPLDELLNLLGYLPLGLLVALAGLRSGWPVAVALATGVLGPALLSYALEVLQHLLPGRHPSLKDWAMNSLGALAGTLLAWLLQASGLLRRWQRWRHRWLERHGAGGLALLALWPFGLLFPAPVPWGLGQIGPWLRETLLEGLDGVPWAGEWASALAEGAAAAPLGPLAERMVATLGLLAPMLLVATVTRPGLQRLALALSALLMGGLGMTLSTLLHFGPPHALAWITPAATVGTLACLALALPLALLPQRVASGLALMALASLLALVSQAPTDPYFAQNLQAWEQGRFVHFHGLAQWIGWLWPFVAIGWLLARLARREG